MYTFQVTLHPRSDSVTRGDALTIDGRDVVTLTVPAAALAEGFPVTFEEALRRLAELPRMYAEPDGSFVWVSSTADARWQVDGILYDRNDRLLFVELKGSCPPAALDQLLTAVGWPATAVMFQLTRHALYVDEAAFRAFAPEAG